MGLFSGETQLLSTPYLFLLLRLCITKATIISTTSIAIATSSPTVTPAPTAALGKEACLLADPRDMVFVGTRLLAILTTVETAPAPVVPSEGEMSMDVAEVYSS